MGRRHRQLFLQRCYRSRCRQYSYNEHQSTKLVDQRRKSLEFLTRATFDDIAKFTYDHFKELSGALTLLNHLYVNYELHPYVIWTILFDKDHMNANKLKAFTEILLRLIQLNSLTQERIDEVVEWMDITRLEHSDGVIQRSLKSYLDTILECICPGLQSECTDENKLYLLFGIGFTPIDIYCMSEEDRNALFNKPISVNAAQALRFLNRKGISAYSFLAYFFETDCILALGDLYRQALVFHDIKFTPSGIQSRLLDQLYLKLHDEISKELEICPSVHSVVEVFLRDMSDFNFLNPSGSLRNILNTYPSQVELACSLGISIFELAQFDIQSLENIFRYINPGNSFVLRHIKNHCMPEKFLEALIAIDVIEKISQFLAQYNSICFQFPDSDEFLNRVIMTISRTETSIRDSLDNLHERFSQFSFVKDDCIRTAILYNKESFRKKLHHCNLSLNQIIDLPPEIMHGIFIAHEESCSIIMHLSVENIILRCLLLHTDVIVKINAIIACLQDFGENPTDHYFLQKFSDEINKITPPTLESIKSALTDCLLWVSTFSYTCESEKGRHILYKHQEELLVYVSDLEIPFSKFTPYFLSLSDLQRDRFMWFLQIHPLLLQMKKFGVTEEQFLTIFLKVDVIVSVAELTTELESLKVDDFDGLLEKVAKHAYDAVNKRIVIDECSAIRFANFCFKKLDGTAARHGQFFPARGSDESIASASAAAPGPSLGA